MDSYGGEESASQTTLLNRAAAQHNGRSGYMHGSLLSLMPLSLILALAEVQVPPRLVLVHILTALMHDVIFFGAQSVDKIFHGHLMRPEMRLRVDTNRLELLA